MSEPKIINCGHCRRKRAPKPDRLTDDELHKLIGDLYVLPTRQKIVRVRRDDVLALIREVRDARALTQEGG